MWEEGGGRAGVGDGAVVEVGGGAVDDGDDGVVEVGGVLHHRAYNVSICKFRGKKKSRVRNAEYRTLFPSLSTQIIRFLSSTLSSPAIMGMIVSGGMCASPGPTFIAAFFAVGAGRGIGRVSPGRTRFAGN